MDRGWNGDHIFDVDRTEYGLRSSGFFLLFLSAVLIGLWAHFGKHRGILFLQLFYATAGLIGMVRWF
jgi:hypothetical protein